MDAQTVKQHIKNKTFDKFYIFTGEEIAIQNIYINKIADISDMAIKRIDTVAELFGSKRGSSFVKQSYCYVVRDDKDFMKNEKAWPLVKSVIGSNMLILLITQVDKRSKFYKQYKDNIVEFNKLEMPVILRYIYQEIDLNESNATKLAELCERDYSRVLLEIDKIKSYQAARSSVDSINDAFELLVSKGVIYQPPKDAIFDFADAVLSRKVRLSFELLQDCKGVGEATLVMQSVLYNQMKHLLQVQSCTSNDISKSTGLSGWDIKLVKDKCGKYSNRELVSALQLLQNIEKGIKIGTIEDSVAIDYFLVNTL